MFCLDHSHATVHLEAVSTFRSGIVNTKYSGADVVWGCIPVGIADMHLVHHMIPFAIRYLVIIFMAEQRIAQKTLPHMVSPSVGIRIGFLCQLMIHRHTIIHIVEVGQCLYGEEDKLTITVVRL